MRQRNAVDEGTPIAAKPSKAPLCAEINSRRFLQLRNARNQPLLWFGCAADNFLRFSLVTEDKGHYEAYDLLVIYLV